MIKELFYIKTDETEPWRNIALEEFLLDHAKEGQATLYLWQNRRTVVIGRNQNPWKECKVDSLEASEGFLARRLSGGGAVFHDLGNLNFTFVMKKEDYNVDRQLNVLIEACAALGIHAEKSGRNDATVDGMKFSGNAFFERQGNCYHHGTILIRSVKEDIAKFLTVDPRKMKGKGVKSVKSRVCNLTDFKPDLTVDEVALAMRQAFEKEYGGPSQPYEMKKSDWVEVEYRRNFFASFDWLYGKTLPFNFERDQRFDWGSVAIRLDIEGALIRSAQVDTDALEWEFFAELKELLTGLPYRREVIMQVLQKAAARYNCSPQIAEDLIEMILSDVPKDLLEERKLMVQEWRSKETSNQGDEVEALELHSEKTKVEPSKKTLTSDAKLEGHSSSQEKLQEEKNVEDADEAAVQPKRRRGRPSKKQTENEDE